MDFVSTVHLKTLLTELCYFINFFKIRSMGCFIIISRTFTSIPPFVFDWRQSFIHTIFYFYKWINTGRKGSWLIVVSIINLNLSIFLYAYDRVLIASNQIDLQPFLNKVTDSCKFWRVLINTYKSKVVHFRPSHIKRSEYKFKIGRSSLHNVNK